MGWNYTALNISPLHDTVGTKSIVYVQQCIKDVPGAYFREHLFPFLCDMRFVVSQITYGSGLHPDDDDVTHQRNYNELYVCIKRNTMNDKNVFCMKTQRLQGRYTCTMYIYSFLFDRVIYSMYNDFR